MMTILHECRPRSIRRASGDDQESMKSIAIASTIGKIPKPMTPTTV
jgi:hypothetical protein